ncbi:MAG: GGDEF domain-containing protein [Bacteroidales bacterium]|nr:GGDEF domain-containing protein [Clostridium sp.]MCM1204598.1 GGDEF domain-containing protein [Bacteroidales bacterium]
MGKRLNIGLFIDDIDAVFTSEAVKGAELGAIAIDANIYIFPGMYLDGADISDDHVRYEYQYNTLFQFASEKHLDVLYVMMGMIGCRVSTEEQLAFLRQYLNIPIVTLYTKMEGYQSIIFDNQIAFMQGIRHLIVDHHVTKVGYVSGPKTNVDAMERLDAYRKVLEETGIPYNEDYVIYGNFEESSESKIGAFVAAHPEMEAIVFANDRMALGGYRAFAKMKIKVGQDILVASFDNSSFAPSLTPPLTTVEANAAELSYKAIANAEKFVKTGRLDNLRVDTHLVRRSSCGCLSFNYQTISERLDINKMLKEHNKTPMMERIYDYLFGEYVEGDALCQIKDDLAVFVKMLCEMIEDAKFSLFEKDVTVIFLQIISQPLFRYTTAELFFDVLMSLQYELRNTITDIDQQLTLMDLFSSFYRELAITNWQVIHGQQEGMEKMSRLINSMTVDMFRMDDGGRIPYERALDNLSSVGMHTAYLFTFEQPIHHPREASFQKPDKLLFRAYCNKDGAFGIPEEEQLIPVDGLFNHDKLPANRRVTMVLSPLFSDEELYGILMSELHYEYFRNVAPVTIQISVALKSLSLLEQQNKIHQQLQENLAQMSENNDFLSEISKTDQLTGLYNRWGFLEQVKEAIANPRNDRKETLVLYADMDNLKMINDEYGHDEGDFALKEIASILKEAFRNTDIVARFGGDEFVAFALLGIPDYENIMKRRIAEITARHNKMVNKPYPIEMSTGICELYCCPSLDISSVLEIADKKLYLEKKAKKEKHGGRPR